MCCVRFVADIFRGAGCDSAEAEGIAFHLVAANLAGHDSHGVIRVPRYVDDIRLGRTLVGQTVTVLTESATHAVLDGNYGFGQTIGEQAVDIGIAKARAAGLAVVALRRTGHLGRIGDWAERAAAAGLISLHFVNVGNGELVAPFGGTGGASHQSGLHRPSSDGRAADAAARHGNVDRRRGQGAWWPPTAASRCPATRSSAPTAICRATRR